MLQPDQATITFAVPYYSTPALLIETIASVFEQSRNDWLLEIYDDNPDMPLDVGLIRTWLDDPRVSYQLNTSNLGISGNWNQCLDSARTDLVTILHSDDRLLPDYTQVMTDLAAARPHSAALFCQAVTIGANGRECFSMADWIKSHLRKKLPGSDLFGESGVVSLLKGNHIMCPTVCYRRSAVAQERFSSQWRFVLDLEFFLRLMMAGNTISGTEETAYAYRRHGASQTSILSEDTTRFTEEAACYDAVATQLTDLGWHLAAETARRKRMIRLHLLYRVLTDLLHFRIVRARRKLTLLADI